MKVFKNGKMVEMTYDEICSDLGFIADVHFIDVKKTGSIGFTAGKPQEVRALIRAVREKGYKMSQDLNRMSRGAL